MQALSPAQRASAIVGPMAVAFAFHALFLGVFVLRHQGDVSCLMCAALHDIGRPGLEEIRQGFGGGYDGPDYYLIARHPWERHSSAPVRHLRIVYPAVSWLGSGGGDPQALLWVMPLVNLLAIAGLAGLGSWFALKHGLSPWLGCLVPLTVNACIPALRNLTDLVSTFALAGLLVCWCGRRSPALLFLWAAAAVFGREQNVAFVGIVLLAAAWHRQGLALLALALPLVAWAGWVAFLRGLYGDWPFLSAGNHFAPPLIGMVQCFGERIEQGFPLKYHFRHSLGVGMILFQIGLSLFVLRWRIETVLKLTVLASALMVALGGHEIFIDYWSFGRVYAMLPMALSLACLQACVTWPLPVLASISLLTIYETKHF